MKHKFNTLFHISDLCLGSSFLDILYHVEQKPDTVADKSDHDDDQEERQQPASLGEENGVGDETQTDGGLEDVDAGRQSAVLGDGDGRAHGGVLIAEFDLN